MPNITIYIPVDRMPLDEAIRRKIGLTARIRCFGYETTSIHSRN
jgi:hypothetical protein